MDRQEFLNQVQAIGTCEDDAQRRTMLAALQSGVEQVFTNNETLTSENNTYRADNETLRKANMDLFLQIGKKNPEDTNGQPEPKKLSFNDLFNEKGELK